jgi:chemotaxis protein MotB
MKEKPNPFVSISDLMACVSAVIMLLLVVMVVKMSVMKQAAEEEKRQQIEAAEQQKRKGVRETIRMIDQKLKEARIESVSVQDSVITLNDQAFERGSACLSSKIDSILKQQIAPIISEAIREHNNIWVQFEGHTDAVDVHGVSANLAKCAVFDDNYSLSAGRAREARKAVLSTVQGDAAISRRISVVGYGPDQLKNEADPNAAENRRVEIRLVAR